jgi:HK97 family phage prohead protease
MRRAPTQGERCRKTLVLRVLETNDAERTIVHTITEKIVDRDGDVIEPRGARLDNFLKNPVVLFGHDSWAFPVGKNLALDVHDQNITALTQFAGDAQAHPQAETAYRLARDGFLKAWSIGFMPITWSEDKALPSQDGWWFKEWELYEYSLVPIPSNPEALSRIAKGYGLPQGATEKDLLDAFSKDRKPFWDLAGSFTKQDQVLADRVALLDQRVAQCETDIAGMQSTMGSMQESVTADDIRAAMNAALMQFAAGAGVR